MWPPFAAFIYRNVPAFELKQGDILAFDTQSSNDVDIQLDVDLASTTTNGGEIAGQPFTRLVLNTQLASSPRGDGTPGNFELRYPVIAPYKFPGGGLIIRFSNPSTAFAADGTGGGNIVGASSTDPSLFFVRRAYNDPDGVAPWNGDFSFIGGFRVVTAEEPPAAALCQGKPVTISGSTGADTITGTQAADVINALSGNDTVRARRGNDTICGGNGKDTIGGGAGRDRLNGENGADLLRGGKGKDTANGGPGKDTLVGGPKNDVCIGGPGRDIARNC